MENKEAYIDKIETRLREWSAKTDDLKVQAHLAKAEARDEYQRKIHLMKDKQSEISGKLDELRNSGSEVWDELEFSIETGMRDMKGAMKDAVDYLKKLKNE